MSDFGWSSEFTFSTLDLDLSEEYCVQFCDPQDIDNQWLFELLTNGDNVEYRFSYDNEDINYYLEIVPTGIDLDWKTEDSFDEWRFFCSTDNLPQIITLKFTIGEMKSPIVHKNAECRFKNTLFAEMPNSDVMIKVDSRQFQAHKWVLSMQSEVFKKMLESHMIESSSGEIEITDCTSDAFEVFLRYIYTETYSEDALSNNLAAVLGLACKYMVDGLIEECTNHLTKLMTIKTIVDVLISLDNHGLTAAKHIAQKFAEDNLAEIIVETDIVTCAPQLLLEMSKAVVDKKRKL